MTKRFSSLKVESKRVEDIVDKKVLKKRLVNIIRNNLINLNIDSDILMHTIQQFGQTFFFFIFISLFNMICNFRYLRTIIENNGINCQLEQLLKDASTLDTLPSHNLPIAKRNQKKLYVEIHNSITKGPRNKIYIYHKIKPDIELFKCQFYLRGKYVRSN